MPLAPTLFKGQLYIDWVRAVSDGGIQGGVRQVINHQWPCIVVTVFSGQWIYQRCLTLKASWRKWNLGHPQSMSGGKEEHWGGGRFCLTRPEAVQGLWREMKLTRTTGVLLVTRAATWVTSRGSDRTSLLVIGSPSLFEGRKGVKA